MFPLPRCQATFVSMRADPYVVLGEAPGVDPFVEADAWRVLYFVPARKYSKFRIHLIPSDFLTTWEGVTSAGIPVGLLAHHLAMLA